MSPATAQKLTLEMIMHFYFPKQKKNNNRKSTHAFHTRCCVLCVPTFARLFSSVLLYHWSVFACPERGPCSVCMCVCHPLWLLAPVCTDEYKFGPVPYGRDAGFCFFLATPPCFPQSPKTDTAAAILAVARRGPE